MPLDIPTQFLLPIIFYSINYLYFYHLTMWIQSLYLISCILKYETTYLYHHYFYLNLTLKTTLFHYLCHKIHMLIIFYCHHILSKFQLFLLNCQTSYNLLSENLKYMNFLKFDLCYQFLILIHLFLLYPLTSLLAIPALFNFKV